MNFLENNPFYLLDVMPTDTRATIVAKAEEKSFRLGDDVCSEAQASLLNPSKRLSAEMDWFCDCGEDDINDIRLSIECAEWIYNETIDKLTCLSKLNAMLFNFAVSDFDDNDEDDICSAIKDIDKQYSVIDEVSIAGVINACRSKAGLLPVSADEVGRELKKKREQIKHLISDDTRSMEEDDYVHLVELLSLNYYDYKAGVIIDDIVDQYELKMHTSIEMASNEIVAAVARIKRIVNKEGIVANLTCLIKKIDKWDKLVTPLQYKSRANGVDHRISEDLGWKIRDFALWLHEERDMTEQALTLVNSARYVFSLIVGLRNAFDNDIDKMRNVLEISDEDWALLEPLLPDGNEQDNREFINAVFWILRTESPWNHLPMYYYGSWESVRRRFHEWREKGVWEKVLEVLIDLPEYEWLMTGAGETVDCNGDKEHTKYILPCMRMICRSDYLSQRISKLMVLRRLSD